MPGNPATELWPRGSPQTLVPTCMYVYIYICIYTCMCMCICICIQYVYIYVHVGTSTASARHDGPQATNLRTSALPVACLQSSKTVLVRVSLQARRTRIVSHSVRALVIANTMVPDSYYRNVIMYLQTIYKLHSFLDLRWPFLPRARHLHPTCTT